MKTALVALIVIAAGLVIISGVWVAVSLVAAVFHTKRSDPPAGGPAPSKDAARAGSRP